MYAIAIVGDLLSLVPFLNIVTGALTALLLYIFAPPEENIFSKDTELTLITMALEFIPGLSMIPTFTIRVWWAKRKATIERHRQSFIQ